MKNIDIVEELLTVKDKYEPRLSEVIFANGQMQDCRRLLMADKDFTIEQIALMRDAEIADALQIKYKFVGYSGGSHECIMLVPREQVQEFEKLVRYICR